MSWIWIDPSTSTLLQASMVDDPVSRSGRRLRARIKYPHPLIDCQTLCVWKPPSGPGVNSCTNTGRRGRTAHIPVTITQVINSKGKKHLFKAMFGNVVVSHIEILLCCPSTGNERESIQDRSDVSDGITFFRVIKYSVESRSTGFDLKGLCQTGGYVWKQTDSPGEIPAAAQTAFVETVSCVEPCSASFVWLPFLN